MAKHPEVVVLGSSHALIYSKLIDDLCHEMHISVAFLGVDSTPVFLDTTPNFNFSSPLEASEFDQAREKWLKQWHPSKQALALANSDIASFPNLSVLNVDSPFYNQDQSIRYASGRSFLYADEGSSERGRS